MLMTGLTYYKNKMKVPKCRKHKKPYCNTCIYDNSVTWYVVKVRKALNSKKDYKYENSRI